MKPKTQRLTGNERSFKSPAIPPNCKDVGGVLKKGEVVGAGVLCGWVWHTACGNTWAQSFV